MLATSPKWVGGNFSITDGKGFGITFANGYAVSVQFGPGEYCMNYYMENTLEGCIDAGRQGSPDAECALIDPSGKFVFREEWDGDIGSELSPAQVLALMNEAAGKPGKDKEGEHDE